MTQFPPLLNGRGRTYLSRSKVLHGITSGLVQMLVAVIITSNPVPRAGCPPHTGPCLLASSEMQAQPGVMKTLHPGWMPHTTDSLHKKGGKNHENHTSSPPPEFFFNFYFFLFFFFPGLLNKQKSSIFKRPCGKKREGWGLGSADKALIGSLIHLHSLRWSRGEGAGKAGAWRAGSSVQIRSDSWMQFWEVLLHFP